MAGLRGKALIAYLLVCTVWGSTYLAIRIGVAHLPPFLFAGVRFLTAGLLLTAIIVPLGIKLPHRARDWRTLAITGVFLLCGANAIVVWSEQFVASGVASVLVASMPLWAAFFDAIVPGGKTPLTWRIGVGLGLGFLGTALLASITPHEIATADLRGPIALTLDSEKREAWPDLETSRMSSSPEVSRTWTSSSLSRILIAMIPSARIGVL